MSVLDDLAGELGVDAATLRASLLAGDEAEALQPTYLTTTPDGKVNASFSGKIEAQGLDFQAVQGAANLIRWLRQSDGAVVDEIAAWDILEGGGGGPSFHNQHIEITAANLSDPTPAIAQLLLNAYTGGTTPSGITAVAENEGHSQVQAKTIIAADGTSDFLQLAATAQLAVAIGVAAPFFNASAETSISVAHGLPRTPQYAAATGVISGTGDAGDQTNWTVYSRDATDVGFYGRSSRGGALGPGGLNILWIAIG